MTPGEVWWKQEIPWPDIPPWFAVVAAFLALVGIVVAGFDNGSWFLAPPGFGLVAFGLPWLACCLGERNARTWGGILTALMFAAGLRWMVSDEIALGVWVLTGAIFMARRLRRWSVLT